MNRRIAAFSPSRIDREDTVPAKRKRPALEPQLAYRVAGLNGAVRWSRSPLKHRISVSSIFWHVLDHVPMFHQLPVSDPEDVYQCQAGVFGKSHDMGMSPDQITIRRNMYDSGFGVGIKSELLGKNLYRTRFTISHRRVVLPVVISHQIGNDASTSGAKHTEN